MTDEWLTVEELASWLKLSREWIYDKVANHEIPFHRLGRQIRFRRPEVETWLEDLRNPPQVLLSEN